MVAVANRTGRHRQLRDPQEVRLDPSPERGLARYDDFPVPAACLFGLHPAGTARTSIGVPPDPRFNCRSLPNATGCQFRLGGWEIRVALYDLVDTLRGDTKQLGNLLRSHEMMWHSARLLDVP